MNEALQSEIRPIPCLTLECLGPSRYPADMRSDIRFPVLMLGVLSFTAIAQEPPIPVPPVAPKPAEAKPAAPTAPAPSPAVDAQTKFYAEQFRRLRGEIDEIKDAHAQQMAETEKLRIEVKQLTASNTRLTAKLAENFATAEDLAALRTSLKELDGNRIEDREALKQAIVKLGDLINKVARQKPATQPVDPNPRTVAQDFKYNEHKVETGEFLSTIILAYNRHYKEEGLGTVTQTQVLKANPGLNPNRLLVGQKIKIPLPGEIK